MNKKSTAADVVDFPVSVNQPKATKTKKKADDWDGRLTKVPLFRPLIRDGIAIGPGDPCLGFTEPGTYNHHPCTLGPDGGPSTDHQFHVRASKGPDGEWVGPDADHLRDLIGRVIFERAPNKDGSEGEIVRTLVKGGVVLGSEIESQWKEARRHERELIGHQYDIGSGEYGEWTVEDLRASIASGNALAEDGISINPQVERDMRREEAVETGRQTNSLLRELIAERKKTAE